MAKYFRGPRGGGHVAQRGGGGHFKRQQPKNKLRSGFKPHHGGGDHFNGNRRPHGKFGGKPKFGGVTYQRSQPPQKKHFKKEPKPDKDTLAVEMSKYWEKAGNKDKGKECILTLIPASEAAHALDNELLEYKKKAEEVKGEEKKTE